MLFLYGHGPVQYIFILDGIIIKRSSKENILIIIWVERRPVGAQCD